MDSSYRSSSCKASKKEDKSCTLGSRRLHSKSIIPTTLSWSANRLADVYPRRETGFESSYDFVDLDFPDDDWDVFEMENDEQGKEVETNGRASKSG